MHGDGVATEGPLLRLDLISLFALVSSTLVLVVAGWEIPDSSDELASVCRSRPASVTGTTSPATVTQTPPRSETTRSTS